jgi:four helix bundle protein
MQTNYRNKNRGYQQLRVWHDAIEFFSSNCKLFRKFPYELKRIASQAIASADSVHRNIAEGYCRRSLREYLQFLNIALDALAFKLENGLLKLVESLEQKQIDGDWTDHLVIKDSNSVYDSAPPLQHSTTPVRY